MKTKYIVIIAIVAFVMWQFRRPKVSAYTGNYEYDLDRINDRIDFIYRKLGYMKANQEDLRKEINTSAFS